jgi:hypothetical protein
VENKYSVVIKIVSAIQASIILLLGVLYFIFGCYMVFADVISMLFGQSGNLSGIMLIFGVPTVILGFILFYGAKSALLVFGLNAKGLRPTVYVSILVTLVLMVYKGAFSPFSTYAFRKGIFSWVPNGIIIWNIIAIFFLIYLRMTKHLIDKGAQAFSPKQKKSIHHFSCMHRVCTFSPCDRQGC